MAQLSPASRYLRFHEAVEELSEEQLDYLTKVDHVDHEAIVALDLEHPEVPGVGVARYIRNRDEPHVAETAVTVADRYQGTGAGTLLLGAIAARAREHGITVFRNYVLDGNRVMLEVFDHLGAHRERENEHLWRVDLEVPDDDQLPDSPAGRAFTEMARDQRRLTCIFPPIWGRRRRVRSKAGGSDEADLDEPELDENEEELGGLRALLETWLRERDER